MRWRPWSRLCFVPEHAASRVLLTGVRQAWSDRQCWSGNRRPRRLAQRKQVEERKAPEARKMPEATTVQDPREATAADIEEFIVMNVLAEAAAPYTGDELFTVLRSCGLKFGDMNIFHRVEPLTLLPIL